MEQESEGGQSAAMQQQWLDLDSQVRAEAILGFHQIRNIEQQLRAVPQGFLGRADGAEAQALRTTIITASVEIVGHFNKIIGRLSAAKPNNSTSYRNDNFSAADRMNRRAESPLSSSHTTYDSSPPHSPRHNTRISAPATHSKIPISQHNSSSPCHTPHSGTSEDSPNPLSPPVHLDSDGVAATSADPEVVKRRSLSVKRKFMPKVTVKQFATGTDPGNDGPPDDGHTWRKYGQKDILGSTNPRSYYRCTHKIELGCPATKFVQRCDDEPPAFDVTYRGNHTCHSIIQQQLPWPFCTPEQLSMIQAHHQLPRSDPSSSPAIANFPSFIGSIVSSSSPQQNQVIANSHEILLGGSRPVFSQPPATGGIPCTPRFGSSSSSIERQQDFSVNSPQPDTYDLRNLIQVTRDGFFGPESNLYNTLLASTRLEQNVIPCTSAEVGLECNGDLKRVKMQQHTDRTRSTSSDNSGLVDKSSDVVQNVEIWGHQIDANGFHSLGLDEQQVLSRFGSNSSVIGDSGQSRRELPNNQPVSAMRGPIDSARESDTSEQRPAQFNIGSVDITDYEIFTSNNSYFTC